MNKLLGLFLIFGFIGSMDLKADSINSTTLVRIIENPISNGDLNLKINKAGTLTDALVIAGSSVSLTIGPASGGTTTAHKIRSQNGNQVTLDVENSATTGGGGSYLKFRSGTSPADRGYVGADATNALSVLDSAGNPKLTLNNSTGIVTISSGLKVSSGFSYIKIKGLDCTNSGCVGSTASNKIRTWGATTASSGSEISRVSSSSSGDYFEAVSAGIYSINVCDQYAGTTTGYIGISVNANSDLTTSIVSLADANVLSIQASTGAGVNHVCWGVTTPLSSGDRIRVHTDANSNTDKTAGSPTRLTFWMAKIL